MESICPQLRLQGRAFLGGLYESGGLQECCTSTGISRVIAGLLYFEGSLCVSVFVLLELPVLQCSVGAGQAGGDAEK